MHFDFRDLELFVAAAEAGSIARAAERCHTVASAASKRLSDLEESFGIPLLVRGARGVELTAAGHALLVRARGLLHQATQIEVELSKYASGARGHVKVFANISAIVEFLPAALASFSQRHAEISVQLEEHVSAEIAQAVADNTADFGIVSELPAIDGLLTIPFRKDELVIVAPPEHPLTRQGKAEFKELLDLPLIGLQAESSLHQLLSRAAADHGKRLSVRIHVTSFDAVYAMVAAGLGVGIVPRAATTPYARSLGLGLITLSETWAQRQLFLCVRGSGSLHSAAQLLLDHLRKL